MNNLATELVNTQHVQHDRAVKSDIGDNDFIKFFLGDVWIWSVDTDYLLIALFWAIDPRHVSTQLYRQPELEMVGIIFQVFLNLSTGWVVLYT